MRAAGASAALAIALASCTSAQPRSSPPTTSPSSTPAPTVPAVPASPSPARRAPPPPAAFATARAMETVRRLAGIGPRDAASEAFETAAREVAATLRSMGFVVRSPAIPVPAGRSMGVEVPAGRTRNVVARPPGLDLERPHLLVGAHLDTVARSPGANDNASGVAVVLEMARLASAARPPLPVVFAIFGGEERRLPGDSGGKYGSRSYLAAMSAAERAALRGMMSVDMVGAGETVLVCSERPRSTLADLAMARAARIGVPARRCVRTASFSDHSPFERAGVPVAWLWTGTHPTFHTPLDVPAVVSPEALGRAGRLAYSTIASLALRL